MKLVRGSKGLARGPETLLSWMTNNLNYLGLFVIVLMIVLLVWRTFKCKPINAIEGLIGSVCLACLVAPVMFNMSYETFGRKLNSEVSAVTRQLSFIENISADIENGLTQLDPAFAGIFDWSWSGGANRDRSTFLRAHLSSSETAASDPVLVYYLSLQHSGAKSAQGRDGEASARRRWHNISKSAD